MANADLKRESLITRLRTFFADSDEVCGMFLGGSLAAGNADDYSDVDFRVVIFDGSDKSKFLSSLTPFTSSIRSKRLKSQGELVALTEWPDVLFVETEMNNYAVLHFDNFVKLDIFIYEKSELSPSIWLKSIKILQDQDDFLLNIWKASQALEYQVSQAEFDFYLSKFYAWFHEWYRRNQRGEGHYAQECRLMCLQILVSFWYMASGNQPNSIGDWSKYEGPRTKLTVLQQKWLKKNLVSADEKNFQEKVAQEILSALTEIKSEKN